MRFFLICLLLSALAACGTKPTATSASPSGPGAPVVFTMQHDGSLRVEVPLRFSFDPGSSTVKPPLAAVLDRIATSQRRGSSRVLVVAPGDKRGKGITLGNDRAGSTRDYLVGRGIAATRFTLASVIEPDLVRIVVSESGPPRLQ